MARARLVTIAVLISLIAACSSSPTAPQPSGIHAPNQASHDATCDSLLKSGYTVPGGHC